MEDQAGKAVCSIMGQKAKRGVSLCLQVWRCYSKYDFVSHYTGIICVYRRVHCDSMRNSSFYVGCQ